MSKLEKICKWTWRTTLSIFIICTISFIIWNFELGKYDKETVEREECQSVEEVKYINAPDWKIKVRYYLEMASVVSGILFLFMMILWDKEKIRNGRRGFG